MKKFGTYTNTMYDMVDVYVVSNAVQGVYENPAYPTCINYYNVTSK